MVLFCFNLKLIYFASSENMLKKLVCCEQKSKLKSSYKMERLVFRMANIIRFSRKSPLNNSLSVSSETEELTNRWILNWETQLRRTNVWQIVESVNSSNRFVDIDETTNYQEIDDGSSNFLFAMDWYLQ